MLVLVTLTAHLQRRAPTLQASDTWYCIVRSGACIQGAFHLPGTGVSHSRNRRSTCRESMDRRTLD